MATITVEVAGMVVDPQGNSVIAVKINNNHRVYRFNPDGEAMDHWDIDGKPLAIATDAQGNISVLAANVDNRHKMVNFSFEGNFLGESPIEFGIRF